MSPANMSSYAGVCIETSTDFQSSLTIAGYQSWMSSSSPSPILGRLSTSETLWDMALERHRGLSRQALRHQADWTLQACTAQQERQVAPPRPCPGSQPPLWLKTPLYPKRLGRPPITPGIMQTCTCHAPMYSAYLW